MMNLVLQAGFGVSVLSLMLSARLTNSAFMLKSNRQLQNIHIIIFGNYLLKSKVINLYHIQEGCMGFHIEKDIDEEKLAELLCGDGGFDGIYDIYEAGAPDFLQMAAAEDLSGDYVGFISCTVPENTEFAEVSVSACKNSSEANVSDAESSSVSDANIPDNNCADSDTALLEAYVSTNSRHNGVFTLMFEIIEKELAKLCGENVPAIITSMDDDTFEMLKNSRLRPTLHSTEYLYGIDREHFESRCEDTQNGDSILNGHQKHISLPEIHSGDYHCTVTEDEENRLCFQAIDSEDFIIGELFLDLSETTACINDVWVDEACRKKGVATALVSHALKNYFSSKDTADNTVILHVTGSNTAAVRLYKKCGFFEIECVKYYIVCHISCDS
jgi:ribosomal protein S18 acetylase RimI-like enzyme